MGNRILVEIDIGSPTRRTRRQLLAGGTGALAAVLTAGAIARPSPAAAANGDNVILGQLDNSETAVTAITNFTDGQTALDCEATGSGTALLGSTGSGRAVAGFAGAGGTGVYGQTDSSSGSGVAGINLGAGNGVFGNVHNSGASGVYGQNDGAAGPARGLGPLGGARCRQKLVHRAPEQAGAGPHHSGVVRGQLTPRTYRRRMSHLTDT